MALTHTDRGDTQAANASPAAATLDSASFTPAVGALITVCISSGLADGGAGAGSFTMSSTGWTTGGWTIAEEHFLNDGGTFSLKSYIAWAVVATSAAGVARATRSGGSIDGTYMMQVDEWAGQAASPIGLHNSADDARASGTTLTVGFGGTPASTSGAVGIVGDNNGSTAGAVQPTGWTETSDRGDAGSGTSYDAAFILTGAGASPQWTSLQSSTFGKTGSVLEILAATTTPTPRVLYGKIPERVLYPSIEKQGITIGTAPATPPPVARTRYVPFVPQPVVPVSYYVDVFTTLIAPTAVPVADVLYGKFPAAVVPPSFIELGLVDAIVETVPVPTVLYGKSTNQVFEPSQLMFAFVINTAPAPTPTASVAYGTVPPYVPLPNRLVAGIDPNVVETVPVPHVSYGESLVPPVFPSQLSFAFDANVAETVPVPVTEYGKLPSYVPSPSSLATGFNASDVSTVPVPSVKYGDSLAQQVPIGYILLGLPDQLVETVPVPIVSEGIPHIGSPQLSYALTGVVPPVTNTGGQLIPVLAGVAIAPPQQPSKLYQGVTIGTAPVQQFTAYTLYANVAVAKPQPSSIAQGQPLPDMTAHVLYGNTVAQPLSPSQLIRGLYHPDVETVPVLRALVSNPPQGVVVTSETLTGAYPQQPITFSTRLYAKARDLRQQYPSWIQLALQQGLAPDIAIPGLVVITFDGDTVQISYALTYVDIAFQTDTVDVVFASTFVDTSIDADTVEVQFRV
jgi:hypothetical protein